MKKLKCIVVISSLLLTSVTLAKVGNDFPELTGETVFNKKINIPTTTNGRYTIIGLASSKKSEAALRTWMQPVYDMFINQNTFIPIDYNVNIYFVPMFSGVNKMAYNNMKKRTQSELDTELHPYVLFYKGNVSDYEDKLNLKDKKKPYFFVLDEKGKIIYSTSGAFTQKKLNQIEDLVSE
jgi:hypothetical protein